MIKAFDLYRLEYLEDTKNEVMKMAESVLRCIVLYLAVILAVRVMGKRQIGELQPSELVVTIMISEFAALPLQDINFPLLWGLVPMFFLVALELIMSFLTLKSIRLRAFFYGQPILLIYNGKINREELLKTRVSVEDVMEAMRANGLLRIEDIHTAVLETNGTISIIPKPELAPPSAKDMKIKVEKCGGMPQIIVMDGTFVKKNMEIKGVDEQQIEKILHGYGVPLDQVFMLTIDDLGKTYLVSRSC